MSGWKEVPGKEYGSKLEVVAAFVLYAMLALGVVSTAVWVLRKLLS